jgi:hypothetical protein
MGHSFRIHNTNFEFDSSHPRENAGRSIWLCSLFSESGHTGISLVPNLGAPSAALVLAGCTCPDRCQFGSHCPTFQRCASELNVVWARREKENGTCTLAALLFLVTVWPPPSPKTEHPNCHEIVTVKRAPLSVTARPHSRDAAT